METLQGLFADLVDDAAMFPPGEASVEEAVAGHQRFREEWFASLIGPLVVADQRLAAVARQLGEGEKLPVSVINTSGAGGLLPLAERHLDGVEIVAVESALRDFDDLVSNAGRVIAAAAALPSATQVFVELPYVHGWQQAAAEVEAAGLMGKIRTGGLEVTDIPTYEQLADQLRTLVELDLPFKATAGLHHTIVTPSSDSRRPQQHGFLNLLLALDILIDQDDLPAATAALAFDDSLQIATMINNWDALRVGRVRRRFQSFGCCGVTDPVDDLVRLGLITAAS